jgi:hypothetical protein
MTSDDHTCLRRNDLIVEGRHVTKKSRENREGEIDLLFDESQDILDTHNISGAKVLYLLAHAAGHTDTTWGEAQAAHGLGLVFCYKRGNFGGTVYSSNMDLPKRAGALLGCRFNSTWTADPREAWAFLKAGLDAGNPVKIAGPEDSVICNYTSARRLTDRSLSARGVGGPSLSGNVDWDCFAEWVPRWVRLGGGGMYCVAKKTKKPPVEKIVRILAKRVADWQENHPAAGRCGTPDSYGISALESFLADLLQPEIEIPGAERGCTPINFQHNARSALADFFRTTAKKLSGKKADMLGAVATSYRKSARCLRRFAEDNLAGDRNTKSGQRAIKNCVGAALEAEKNICGIMEKLRSR